MTHLEESKRVTVEYIGGDMYIKFKSTVDEKQITEVDCGLLKLKKTISQMDKEVEQMEGEANYLDLKTRDHLKKNEKSLAAKTLRKRKWLKRKSINMLKH